MNNTPKNSHLIDKWQMELQQEEIAQKKRIEREENERLLRLEKIHEDMLFEQERIEKEKIENKKFSKGEIIIATSGEYSEYGIIGLFEVLEDCEFDKDTEVFDHRFKELNYREINRELYI